MPKKKHRIISRAVAAKAANHRGKDAQPQYEPCILPPKTHTDEVYELIERACTEDWHFTDEDGRMWIRREDVEDRGDGIFIVRFRCSLAALQNTVVLNKRVERVCAELHSEVRYICGMREKWYLGKIRQVYYECVWIISEGELAAAEPEGWEDNSCESCIDTQEEIEGELTDESTVEEIEERIEKGLENFV